ncbi:hypothetical protein RA28_04285 [Ruegeria sp. ANG-S4]|uniref:DUF1127 domain-containing protein n=1 Tax=Ruegeria sp. ANG-S4 TaxID=1577904 RepID=UPI00057DF2E6|nr:DUF1127 domain-containing protein [Ruegeria sp. ANG-S4]KIC46947.1 hypothetical protein RA28_04285 [Ruegeria sp. ANG-S4]
MTLITQSQSKCGVPASRRFKLLDFLSLARQRRALARLDARALEDIGVTREQAQSEAARPMWDAPDNWLKSLY